MNKNFKKNIISWMLIIGAIFVLSGFFDANISNKNNIIFSDFLKKIDNNEIQSVDIRGKNITGRLKDGENFYTMSIITLICFVLIW